MRGSEDRSCRALWAAVRTLAFVLRTLAFAVGGMEGSEQRRDGSDSGTYRLPLWGLGGNTVGTEDGRKENSSSTQLSRGEFVCVPPTN